MEKYFQILKNTESLQTLFIRATWEPAKPTAPTMWWQDLYKTQPLILLVLHLLQIPPNHQYNEVREKQLKVRAQSVDYEEGKKATRGKKRKVTL